MYKKIKIFIFISVISFILVVGISIIGNFLPSQTPSSVKFAFIFTIIFMFLLFSFSTVPVIIWAVLRASILMNSYLKRLGQLADSDIRVKILNFIIRNEERMFYYLLIFFWGIFIIGLIVAVPFMIKEGSFAEIFDSLTQ